MSAPLVRSFFSRNEQSRQQTVQVIPGFGANDRYTWPLRACLNSLGYAMDWGLGTNKAGPNMPHSPSDLHSRWNWSAALRKSAATAANHVIAPQVRDEFEDQAAQIKIHLRQPAAARPGIFLRTVSSTSTQ